MMANSKRIESFTFINDDCRAVDTRSEEGQRQDDRIAKDRISAGIELRRGKKMQPLSRLGAHIPIGANKILHDGSRLAYV